jgi:RNA polymerase sigma-70 factor (ECF subfamily)
MVLQVAECARRLSADGVCALGALFDLASPRLVRLAVTVTRNQHDAEDAVQSVLVRVGTEPELLLSARCPWAYLLRMTRNAAIETHRRRRRLRRLTDLTDLLVRRTVDQLDREDVHRAVWRALRRLPTAQAEVVVLKIWEELTFAQVAEILDISPNTAASRYQYAMAKLAQHLHRVNKEACL